MGPRARLFTGSWALGQHLSNACEVRRLITAVMWPQEDITDRLVSPEIPSLLLHDTDLARMVRRSGGTIAPDGQPLTSTGWRRIRQWRQEWLAPPSQVIPAVVGPDQALRTGTDGLRYLADLATVAGLAPRLRTGTDTAPAWDRRPVAAAQGGLTGQHGHRHVVDQAAW